MNIPSTVQEEVDLQIKEKLTKKSPEDYKKTTPHDVLFFPRKRIRMMQEWRLYTYEKALFRGRETTDYSTRLEEPTIESGVGLISGLRSAIILDKNGHYLKLKGINAKINKARLNADHGFYYGLCTAMEALWENVYLESLIKKYSFMAANPGFTELHNFGQTNDIPITDDGKTLYSEKLKPNLKKSEEILIGLGSRPAVSGLEIKSDTRLDETIYHLTKNQLTGKKEKIRDNILHYLCFNAGISKACLTIAGYNWGEFLENTNCHIGNFVIDSTPQGIIDTKIIDVYSLRTQKTFGSEKKFIEFSHQEVDSFDWDFGERITSSFPHQKRYKFFTEELRKECLMALKTGYYLSLMYTDSKKYGLSKTSGNLLIPSIPQLSAEEFRYEIKRLTK